MAKKATEKFYGTGRRKSSIARVYVMPGKGNITINKRDINDYFGLETLKVVVRQPLTLLEATEKYKPTGNIDQFLRVTIGMCDLQLCSSPHQLQKAGKQSNV